MVTVFVTLYYIQETGRKGRDGFTTVCSMYYRDQDIATSAMNVLSGDNNKMNERQKIRLKGIFTVSLKTFLS
jgi:superfamily II DNA helicase RecQ